jgi:alpha-ketoglutarate-dependent taurine dioxygenase
MSTLINPILINSFSDVQERIEQYAKVLISNGVVVFRGAEISSDEQCELLTLFGNIMEWIPNTSNPTTANKYKENHLPTINARKLENNGKSPGNDEILVQWHMEHIGFPNPACGATWNMKIFTCSENSGKTYFVDAQSLVQFLSTEEKDFMQNCVFIEDVRAHSPGHCAEDFSESIEPICPIVTHPITGQPIVYLPPQEIVTFEMKLYKYLGKAPTDYIRARFGAVCRKIVGNILNNEKVLIVHKWQQNDIVFVDLLRMYHAVTGGFNESERYFEGIWAFRNNRNLYLQ